MDIKGIAGKALSHSGELVSQYRRAVLDGNQDAIKALLKVAPKVHRVATKAESINTPEKAVFYAAVSEALSAAPNIEGTDAEVRAGMALRQSYQRRMNGVQKWAEEVNSL